MKRKERIRRKIHIKTEIIKGDRVKETNFMEGSGTCQKSIIKIIANNSFRMRGGQLTEKGRRIRQRKEM